MFHSFTFLAIISCFQLCCCERSRRIIFKRSRLHRPIKANRFEVQTEINGYVSYYLNYFTFIFQFIIVAKQKSKKTAEGISRPRDFRHLEHVGFNPDTGFDTSSLNPNLMKFFEKVFTDEISRKISLNSVRFRLEFLLIS